MPRIFVGNFEFEHELIHAARQLSREAKSLAADLVAVWIALADEDDIIWSPTGVPVFDFHELQDRGWERPRFLSSESQLPRGAEWELVPWGWTSQLQAWGERHGWTCPAPPADVVRLVNSRVFRSGLEAEMDVAVPGSRVVNSVEELLSHLANHVFPGSSWVLKANFGMSGRERCLGHGNRLSEPHLNWARKRLELGGLVYEPWLNRIAEAGLQWEVPQTGDPQLMGVTPLLTDASGTYRGSRLESANGDRTATDAWQDAIEVTRQVAVRLQQQGYWGPVGIDAMWHTAADGKVLCRPLQDLNARYTMGRLALGWRRLLPEGSSADWLHDQRRVDEVLAIDANANVIQTTTRSWLVIEPPPSS